jgi:HK97 gp10 family phage protein
VADFRVQLKGARELAGRLGDGDLIDRILRPGFEQAAAIVQGAAVDNAEPHHVTRKLQGSIGLYLDGYGAGLEAHIGPEPGHDAPANYTEADTSHWKTPRSGTNKGDPREYGRYEEEGTRYREGHPFLEPALTDNVGRIEDVLESAAGQAL